MMEADGCESAISILPYQIGAIVDAIAVGKLLLSNYILMTQAQHDIARNRPVYFQSKLTFSERKWLGSNGCEAVTWVRYFCDRMVIVRKVKIWMFRSYRKSIEFCYTTAIIKNFALNGRYILIGFISRRREAWSVAIFVILNLQIGLLNIFAGRCFVETLAIVFAKWFENILHFVHLFVVCLYFKFEFLQKLLSSLN